MNESFNFFNIEVRSVESLVTFKQFVDGKGTVARSIEVLENLFKLDDITDVHEMLDKVTESSLLCFVFAVEFSEVFKGSVHDFGLGFVLLLGFHGSLEPRVLESLSCAYAFFRSNKHVAD